MNQISEVLSLIVQFFKEKLPILKLAAIGLMVSFIILIGYFLLNVIENSEFLINLYFEIEKISSSSVKDNPHDYLTKYAFTIKSFIKAVSNPGSNIFIFIFIISFCTITVELAHQFLNGLSFLVKYIFIILKYSTIWLSNAYRDIFKFLQKNIEKLEENHSSQNREISELTALARFKFKLEKFLIKSLRFILSHIVIFSIFIGLGYPLVSQFFWPLLLIAIFFIRIVIVISLILLAIYLYVCIKELLLDSNIYNAYREIFKFLQKNIEKLEENHSSQSRKISELTALAQLKFKLEELLIKSLRFILSDIVTFSIFLCLGYPLVSQFFWLLLLIAIFFPSIVILAFLLFVNKKAFRDHKNALIGYFNQIKLRLFLLIYSLRLSHFWKWLFRIQEGKSQIEFSNLETDGFNLQFQKHLRDDENSKKFFKRHKNLKIGEAVQLTELYYKSNQENSILNNEWSMWLIVSKKTKNYYIGILDNDLPQDLPCEKARCLCKGTEILFRKEDVVKVVNPPPEYIQRVLKESLDRHMNNLNGLN